MIKKNHFGTHTATAVCIPSCLHTIANISSNKDRWVKLMDVLCKKAACLPCVLLVLLYAGALPMVYASVFCLSWACRWLILSSYCLLSMWGLYKVIITPLKLFQTGFLEKEGFCLNKMVA